MATEPDSSNRTEQRPTESATALARESVVGADLEAVVTLRVPRGAMGDLPTGVRDVLVGVAGVEAVDVGEIRAVRPSSFDIHVDVRARLDVDFETTDPDDVRERLLDGFGIEAVEAVVVDVG